MDFKELETFLKLIECSSYSQTAKALFISQPTVTTRMKSLEEELDVTLLRRSDRGYFPTEEGSILAGYAGRILQLQNECLSSLDRMKNLKTDTLRIGATALGTYILPDITEHFKETYPETNLFFSITNTAKALNNLKSEQVDAVLAPLSLNTQKNEQFHYIHVGYDTLVLAASTQNPLSRHGKVHLSDLCKERFIVREKGSSTRTIFEEWMQRNELFDCSIAEIGQLEAIRRAVAKNIGISLLSTLVFQPEDNSIKALPVKGFPIFREFFIITRKETPHNSLIENFSVFIKDFLFSISGRKLPTSDASSPL